MSESVIQIVICAKNAKEIAIVIVTVREISSAWRGMDMKVCPDVLVKEVEMTYMKKTFATTLLARHLRANFLLKQER